MGAIWLAIFVLLLPIILLAFVPLRPPVHVRPYLSIPQVAPIIPSGSSILPCTYHQFVKPNAHAFKTPNHTAYYWSQLHDVEVKYWPQKLAIVQPHVKATHSVIDFGAGSGEVLARLSAAHKVGVELMDEASDHARKVHKLDMTRSFEGLGNRSFDFIYSLSAFCLLEDPLGTACSIHSHLTPDTGKVLIMVQNEGRKESKWPFVPLSRGVQEKSFHLYTWTPQLLSNLLESVGFDAYAYEEWYDYIVAVGIRKAHLPACHDYGARPVGLPHGVSSVWPQTTLQNITTIIQNHIRWGSDLVIEYGNIPPLLDKIRATSKLSIATPQAGTVAQCLDTLDAASTQLFYSIGSLKYEFNPLATLSLAYHLLRQGGHIILVEWNAGVHASNSEYIPGECYNRRCAKFTWTCSLLGNLAQRAGFTVTTAEEAYIDHCLVIGSK